MPPKKKASKLEWVECPLCKCLFSSKDITGHSQLCNGDIRKTLNTSRSSHRPHGLIINKDVLYGVVHSYAEKVDERLPASIRQDLIQLNPTTMKVCGFSIGKSVCVSSPQHKIICIAWPVVTTPPSYVGIGEKVKKLYNIKDGDIVAVCRLQGPIHLANEVKLVPRTEYDFFQTMEFKKFFLRHYTDKLITPGSKLQMTYFGKPCDFVVVGITGADETVVSINLSEHIFDESVLVDQSEVSFSNAIALSNVSISEDQSELLSNSHQNISGGNFVNSDDTMDCINDTTQDSLLDETDLSDKLESLILKDQKTSTPRRTTKSNDEIQPCDDEDIENLDAANVRVFSVSSKTVISIIGKTGVDNDKSTVKKQGAGYESIGGLSKQLDILREMVELPLKNPEIFERLGIAPPRGVLMYGPPGTGKTMIARAIANETNAYFTTINGPEILSKYVGESESQLREIFKEAAANAPAIIFIDEIDALCPKRESVHSELEKRIVATLLTLTDGMSSMETKGHVIVLGATNRPDSIDTALRRPGRFDRDIEITIPNAKDRADILKKHLTNMPHSLSLEDIEKISESAHGYVGADLAAVCKEAGLHAFKKAKTTVSVDSELCGKTVITSADFSFALKEVKPSAMREITIDVPKVLWSDIGGQAVIKQKLRQAVEWPLRHPEAFQRMGIEPPQGVLLYGPPGCSKTMIVKALATETQLNFIAVKGPELFSKWVGESERAVREVFRKARAAAPSIVFFDEIDALATQRGGSGQAADRVLTQLLTELDGIEKLTDVTVVAATNRPDMIDKALMRPGRIDRILYVPLPDAETRKDIFQIQFRRIPIDGDVNIDNLVSRTDKYSGAEVVAVCHEAALSAMQENIEIPCISSRHFDKALEAVTPRIDESLIKFYEEYQEKSGIHAV
ncbi:ATPase family gene 2 protein homolog A-like [Ptychodera flava]|uniref:ATPase family gene 2 protein homolog A-like n=1 Tax=Ptychodera flava TaxID=63121 RepID=UPI003969CC4C